MRPPRSELEAAVASAPIGSIRSLQSPQMRALITGMNGTVGRALAAALRATGAEPIAYPRDSGPVDNPRDIAARIAASSPDVLFHLAIASKPTGIENESKRINIDWPAQLATACSSAKVRFVFTSTGLVYGPKAGRVVDEDEPCAPSAAYPVSKLAAERFLLGLEGIDVRVLRLPFVYGDGDPHIEEVVPFMRGFPPTQRMSLGHHADVAQAVTRLLDAPAPAHRIYNVVDDVKAALSGMLAPTLREKFLGNAEIREVFNITKVGKIAGCFVTEGMVRRGAKVRLLRDNVVIHEGSLSILKRFKDDVKEVTAGQECGMSFANYQDLREGDQIECFQVEVIARTL